MKREKQTDDWITGSYLVIAAAGSVYEISSEPAPYLNVANPFHRL
jgi:hypothetical protein